MTFNPGAMFEKAVNVLKYTRSLGSHQPASTESKSFVDFNTLNYCFWVMKIPNVLFEFVQYWRERTRLIETGGGYGD